MLKAKVGAWIVGGLVVAGGGLALADTAPPDPVVEDRVVEHPAESPVIVPAHVATPTVEHGKKPDKGEKGEKRHEGAGEEKPAHPDNHGAVVSKAAHDHDFDEACGNHGAYVSEVARGGDPAAPDCATAAERSGDHQGPAGTEADTGEHDRGKGPERAKAAKQEGRGRADGHKSDKARGRTR
jgi:hypothetical protein